MVNLVQPGVTKRANILIWEAETFYLSIYHHPLFFMCINCLINLIGQENKQYSQILKENIQIVCLIWSTV